MAVLSDSRSEPYFQREAPRPVGPAGDGDRNPASEPISLCGEPIPLSPPVHWRGPCKNRSDLCPSRRRTLCPRLRPAPGFLLHSSEGAANRIAQLSGDRRLRERLGENGYLHVRQNFLLTRHVKDYLLTMLALEHPRESVVYRA